MTIRRQYQLPNCSLILDGLSIDPAPGNEDVMSLLVNAECRISGLERSINGGYNFFAALVRAVSQYGQELLSGFAHPQVVEGEPLLVHINPGDGPYHHLVVQPEIADLGGTGDGRAIDIKLSAVQLFDLTEAVDQFFDDRQTLPELEPSLSPLPRRFVRTEQPLGDRAVPAVLGVGGLVVAAMALGMLPLPDMRDPALETSRVDSVEEVASADGSTDGASSGGEPPTGEEAPTGDDVAPAVTPELETEKEDPSIDASAPEQTEEPDAETIARAETEEAIEDSNAVDETEDTELSETGGSQSSPSQSTRSQSSQSSNPAEASAGDVDFEEEPSVSTRRLSEVEMLNAQLKKTIVANREQPRFGDAISYRVRYNEDGTIVGYEAVNSEAGSAVGETPLPNLVESGSEETPAVDYRVVFTERGVVEVSPWWGWSFYE